MIFRFHVRNPSRENPSIFVWTKDTQASLLNEKFAGVITYRTSRPKALQIRSRTVVMGKPVAGKWNARIRGSIAPGGC
jgi:hypothetical protein